MLPSGLTLISAALGAALVVVPMRTASTQAATVPPLWICPEDSASTFNGRKLTPADSVELHPDSVEHDFFRDAAECSGRLSVASMGLRPERVSDRIRVRMLTNAGPDPIWVVHRGAMQRVLSGETTHALDDIAFSGDWGVVVDVGVMNRACGPASAHPPAKPPVRVVIVTACAPWRRSG